MLKYLKIQDGLTEPQTIHIVTVLIFGPIISHATIATNMGGSKFSVINLFIGMEQEVVNREASVAEDVDRD